jgi:phage tail-like protein
MTEISKNNFFFLNRDGNWPGFKRSGLELRDGVLELSSLPMLTGSLSDAVKSAAVPDGPAGLAIDAGGTIYFSDPQDDRVERIMGCDGSVCAAPCIGSASLGPGGFDRPRGLLIPASRSALFVADTANNRIQVFDLASFQLVDCWGQPSLLSSQPGSQPGRFNTPWTLAADSPGNIYVVDYGNQRVQKFDVIGEVIPTFCENVQASGLLHNPSDIAVREAHGQVWVLVVDASPAQVLVFDATGMPVLDANNQPLIIKDAHLTQPMGIAAAGDTVYIGDNAAERVLRFEIGESFRYVGAAIGYQAPVAALLLDGKGNLWVHPGDSLAPVQLGARTGYGTSGSLWIDPAYPLTVDSRTVNWHRLKAFAGSLPDNAHLDLYAYASSDLSQAPLVDAAAMNPFSDPRWQAINYTANLDVTDLYIGGPKKKYLWVGAQFSGDGTASPRVRQLRVEFDYPNYLPFLPAVYRNNADCGEFLLRLLSLFESFFSGVEGEINSLDALFDPSAAPGRFLVWLAACMGFNLDENWSEKTQREIIERIFSLSGRRGTAAGLRECLRLFAGVDAVIEEPMLNAAWWSLPSSDSCCAECAASAGQAGTNWEDTRNSVLGWTTMLAPAQPQGAVVGTTAVLDQSQLITDEDFGSPLFTDVAYQFSVGVYRSQVMGSGALDKVRAVIEQEKPAHTAYQVCVIDPRFQIGLQSRLGIDTVVAGRPRSLALGTDRSLGVDSVLAGPAPSLLGMESQLGVTTRLG